MQQVREASSRAKFERLFARRLHHDWRHGVVTSPGESSKRALKLPPILSGRRPTEQTTTMAVGSRAHIHTCGRW